MECKGVTGFSIKKTPRPDPGPDSEPGSEPGADPGTDPDPGPDPDPEIKKINNFSNYAPAQIRKK